MKALLVKKGDRYGNLTIIKEDYSKKRRSFECKCICGNVTIITLDGLRNGHTKSCGCEKRKKFINRITTHGMSNLKIYSIWLGIKQRCYNKKNSHYKYYGGKGIRCEWNSFEDFYEDMGDSYKEGLSIERINNNKNYCKQNCKWIELAKQGKNKDNLIMYKGKNLKELTELLGVKYGLVHNRIYKLGWCVYDALCIKKIYGNKFGKKEYSKDAIEIIKRLEQI